MKISDIIYREEILLSEVDDELEFEGIKTDTNNLTENDILFLLSERKTAEIEDLMIHPLAIVCGANVRLPDFIPSIRVKDPRLTLSYACYRFENIDQAKMKIIGVTGTNGKTTTAMLIKNVLSMLGKKVGFIGTGKIEINDKVISGDSYSMTTPDPPLLYRSLKQMELQGCEYVVMEASSHALALNKLSPLIFDIAIFTNMSPEHLDFHSDMESYFSAKCSLFEKSKCSIFNIDDEYGRRAYEIHSEKKISAGILWRGDVWASNVKSCGLNGLEYNYHTDNFSFKMRILLPGIYNAYNSMLAAIACIELGCKPCEVKELIGSISSIEGRFEVINDKITVIIDYAHTSFAFNSILSNISAIKKGSKLTVVFGCGGDRDRSKRPKMAKAAEKYADRIILTSDNSRGESTKDIISDIIRGFDKGCYEIKENRSEAIRSAILDAKDGDIVAVIGKGPEKYNIDKSGYHYFNEKEIIMSSLSERAKRG